MFSPVNSYFLAYYFSEKSFLPREYIFEFEVKRLEFHAQTGSLLNLTDSRKNMLIALNLFTRIFIVNILKNFEQFKVCFIDERLSQEKENFIKNQVKLIASVLYYFFAGFCYEECPEVDSNVIFFEQLLDKYLQINENGYENLSYAIKPQFIRTNNAEDLYSPKQLKMLFSAQSYEEWKVQYFFFWKLSKLEEYKKLRDAIQKINFLAKNIGYTIAKEYRSGQQEKAAEYKQPIINLLKKKKKKKR